MPNICAFGNSTTQIICNGAICMDDMESARFFLVLSSLGGDMQLLEDLLSCNKLKMHHLSGSVIEMLC